MTSQGLFPTRSRSRSRDEEGYNNNTWSPPVSPSTIRMQERRHRMMQYNHGGVSTTDSNISYKNRSGSGSSNNNNNNNNNNNPNNYILLSKEDQIYQELGKNARKENDSMVYLDGPRIYSCSECRTHLTSHDEIISKSFHGRHGRAYLFDMCVNVTTGPAEDRRLLTGLHSVSDIFCKRCHTLIGWTYTKAYEPSQQYKEGKYIVEKIHLHMEENNRYQVSHPAGEQRDKWKIRSMSWGDESAASRSRGGGRQHHECSSSKGVVVAEDGSADGQHSISSSTATTIYEYHSRPRARTSSSLASWVSGSTPISSGAANPSSPSPS